MFAQSLGPPSQNNSKPHPSRMTDKQQIGSSTATVGVNFNRPHTEGDTIQGKSFIRQEKGKTINNVT